MGYVDAQDGASGRTAFRTAEKLYKRYKNSSTQLRTSTSRKKVPPIDVSRVLDFRKYAEILKDRSSKVDGVSLASGGPFDKPVFVIDEHPGFYFLPQALSIEEQFYWIQESLASFPQPPNRTNHNAVYGPISDLWASAQQGCVLVEVSENGRDRQQKLLSQQGSGPPHPDGTKDYLTDELSKGFDHLEITTTPSSSITGHADCKDERPPSADASLIPALNQGMCKARIVNEQVEEVESCWRFVHEQEIDSCSNATKRSKHQSAKSLLRKLRWATIGIQFDWSKKAYNTMVVHKELSPKLSELAARLARPAMNGEKFNAESAIVNYYGPDDMLGGHVDDMEANWSKPIVSISLGCKAVFLLGGTSREDTPIAMFLRSGDVVLIAGPARQCFHGVPRIFIEPENADLPDLSTIDQASLGQFLDYIMESRININVRQVH